MHPPDEDNRLISGDGPINLRTALKQKRAQDAVEPQQHSLLIERMNRVHTRNRFGTPLVDQVNLYQATPKRPASGAQIVMGIATACGGVLALLGAIQSHVPLLAVGVAVAVCGAVGWKIVHRKVLAANAPDALMPSPLIFEEAALALFDACLEKAAAELDEENASRLIAIKEACKRISHQAVVHDGHFTVEDRMYLRECLRRYVPDSVDAYLRVPAAQRTQPLLADQPCPQAALRQQLDLLLDEIQLREKKLSRSAAEQLARQQQFLNSKKTR